MPTALRNSATRRQPGEQTTFAQHSLQLAYVVMLMGMGLALGPVCARDDLKTARAEVRQHNLAPWFHDPQHFIQSLFEINNVVHGVHGDHRIKGRVGPRQAGRILNDKLNPLFQPGIAGIEPGTLLLFRRDIDGRNTRNVTRQLHQKAPLAGADFQDCPNQGKSLSQHKLNGGGRVVTKLSQAGLTLQDLLPVGERFRIVCWFLHWTIVCHM